MKNSVKRLRNNNNHNYKKNRLAQHRVKSSNIYLIRVPERKKCDWRSIVIVK